VKLSTLLNKLEDITTEGSSYVAKCPAHEDGKPSLLITLTDENKLLLHCRAGCTKSRVLECLDMRMSDLFDVEADVDDVVMAQSGPPAPPTAEHIQQISDYLAMANACYKGAEASDYALERFGLDPDLGYQSDSDMTVEILL
jgi:putative DNA primase/helicase